jgi:hypothetical protein
MMRIYFFLFLSAGRNLSQEFTQNNNSCQIFIQESTINFPTPNHFFIPDQLNIISDNINRNNLENKHFHNPRKSTEHNYRTAHIIHVDLSYVKHNQINSFHSYVNPLGGVGFLLRPDRGGRRS